MRVTPISISSVAFKTNSQLKNGSDGEIPEYVRQAHDTADRNTLRTNGNDDYATFTYEGPEICGSGYHHGRIKGEIPRQDVCVYKPISEAPIEPEFIEELYDEMHRIDEAAKKKLQREKEKELRKWEGKPNKREINARKAAAKKSI